MSKRILVVEDQPDNRQIIRDMLAPTDYEITEVENGEEAAHRRGLELAAYHPEIGGCLTGGAAGSRRSLRFSLDIRRASARALEDKKGSVLQ